MCFLQQLCKVRALASVIMLTVFTLAMVLGNHINIAHSPLVCKSQHQNKAHNHPAKTRASNQPHNNNLRKLSSNPFTAQAESFYQLKPSLRLISNYLFNAPFLPCQPHNNIWQPPRC